MLHESPNIEKVRLHIKHMRFKRHKRTINRAIGIVFFRNKKQQLQKKRSKISLPHSVNECQNIGTFDVFKALLTSMK